MIEIKSSWEVACAWFVGATSGNLFAVVHRDGADWQLTIHVRVYADDRIADSADHQAGAICRIDIELGAAIAELDQQLLQLAREVFGDQAFEFQRLDIYGRASDALSLLAEQSWCHLAAPRQSP